MKTKKNDIFKEFYFILNEEYKKNICKNHDPYIHC